MRCCFCNKIILSRPYESKTIIKGYCCDRCYMEIVLPYKIWSWAKYTFKLGENKDEEK